VARSAAGTRSGAARGQRLAPLPPPGPDFSKGALGARGRSTAQRAAARAAVVGDRQPRQGGPRRGATGRGSPRRAIAKAWLPAPRRSSGLCDKLPRRPRPVLGAAATAACAGRVPRQTSAPSSVDYLQCLVQLGHGVVDLLSDFTCSGREANVKSRERNRDRPWRSGSKPRGSLSIERMNPTCLRFPSPSNRGSQVFR
jgi:hypothetical protein